VRQSGTPDILRPGWIRPVSRELLPTYGVVLDTSGSMDRALLGKALGAIASYSRARDVPAARVVYCDAAAYDAGYVAADPVSPGPALQAGRLCGGSEISAAAAVRTGDDLEPVPVRALPVQAAATVPVVDLLWLALEGVGPPLAAVVT
jgi:hypothetical protein